MKAIKIGTRGSKLAMWQANWVAEQLRLRGVEVEIVTITTQGDVSTQSLSQVGGQGLFTKEIQRELLAGHVDVAVHSLKDLPTQVIDGLTLAAVPARETTRDCLISRTGATFEQLLPGARIGTGSSRRAAQLLAWRSDVEVIDIRGNVDSRLRKLEEGKYDAIILAAAGLMRLKLNSVVSEELDQDRMLPAVGQGALGLECRTEDSQAHVALQQLNDIDSHASILAERAILRKLGAGCLAPVAALGTVQSDKLTIRARVLAPDGAKFVQGTESGPVTEAQRVGERLAQALLDEGAGELIACARKIG